MTTTVRRRTLSMLSGLSVVVAVAACGTTDSADAIDPAAQSEDTAQSSGETSDAASGSTDGTADGTTTAEGTYTDGTYTAEGSYSSPGGQESIEVELTVSDDTVTAVTVTPEATSGNAQRFQKEFASAISDEVVGKELSGLSVDKVSGSSLTGAGFNEALEQIRSDAAL